MSTFMINTNVVMAILENTSQFSKIKNRDHPSIARIKDAIESGRFRNGRRI